MANGIKMNAEEACQYCIHNSDSFYCGSFCIYGDCFEPIKLVQCNDSTSQWIKNLISASNT